MEYRELSVKRYHEMLKDGQITTRDLVEFYLNRIETYDTTINSIICVNKQALALADELDGYYKEHGLKGKLHGVPILLKDNVDTKDMPTTAGSKSLDGFVPDDDAPIVKRMLDEGAIIIAKTNLHEFAIWGETISSIKGQTINPYDHTRTPGGSSGGTGAAVAFDFGMIGIGTDTINSIRSPSSANCLVGIRPTVGLISKSGVVPYSLTQDAVGPIARTVEDASLLLEVMEGRQSYEIHEVLNLKDINIGILDDFFGEKEVHDEVNKAVHQAIDVLKNHGTKLIHLESCFDSSELVSEVSVHLYELKDHLNGYLSGLSKDAPVHSVQEIIDGGRFHEGIEDNLLKANQLSTASESYRSRMDKRELVKAQLEGLFDKYKLDAILYPHQKQLVCKIGDSQLERNGVLASVTGFPSICIPAGFSRSSEDAPIGVPIGMELLGKPNSEKLLIEIAYAFECLTKIRRSPDGLSNGGRHGQD